MKRFKALFIVALSAIFTLLATVAAYAGPKCVINWYKPEVPEHLKK